VILRRDRLRVVGARNSTLFVQRRDIACIELIVDVYFDLAVAMKPLLASLTLVRVLYMVLNCAERAASRTAVGAQEQDVCRRGAVRVPKD
jgi:hypothetical protein